MTLQLKFVNFRFFIKVIQYHNHCEINNFNEICARFSSFSTFSALFAANKKFINLNLLKNMFVILIKTHWSDKNCGIILHIDGIFAQRYCLWLRFICFYYCSRFRDQFIFWRLWEWVNCRMSTRIFLLVIFRFFAEFLV